MTPLQLLITFDPTTHQLGFGGSPEMIGNQVLTMGVIETAKQMLVKHYADQERRVQPASIIPPGFPGQG